MLFGPVFGAIAVILTGADDEPASLLGGHAHPRGRLERGERARRSSATSRSRPPATRSCAARPRPASKAATLAGLGRRVRSSASSCSRPSGRRPSSSTPSIYGVSFLIYRFGVKDPAGEARGASPASTSGVGRYLELIRTSHVLAARPDLDRGQRGHRAVAQPVGLPARQGRPALPGPGADGAASPPTRSPSGRSSSRSSSARGCCTGATGSRRCGGRRSSGTASSAGPSWWSPGLVVNHLRTTCAGRGGRRGARSPAVGLFVLAGATPAALGLLADMSERFPADRGAIMGLYSVFLALGQIIGALIGGVAADWLGHRRDVHRDARPARHRASSRWRSCGPRSTSSSMPEPDGRARAGAGVTDGRPWVPVPLARGTPRRGRRAAPPRDRGRPGDPAGRRLRGRCRDRDERGARRRHAQQLRHRRRRVLADLGRGGRPPGRAQRVGPGAGRAPTPRPCAGPGLDDDPAARAAVDHGAGRGPLVGRRPRARTGGCRAADLLAPAIELAARRLPGLGRLHRRRSSGPRRWSSRRSGRDAGVLRGLPAARPAVAAGRARPAAGALAATLETLATDGFDAFYDGDLGDAPGARAGGGRLRRSRRPTSRAHASTWGEPIAIDYRGVRVTTHPPNSSGLVALELLAILAQFEPPPRVGVRPGRGDRPALDPPRDRGGQAGHGRSRRAPDRPGRSATSRSSGCSTRPTPPSSPRGSTRAAPPARPRADEPVAAAARSTSRPSTRDGNAVSLIESNYMGFGSGVVDPATGIHYQNRGSYFSLDPDHPNVLAPGKRTLHTLLPGMLFRDGVAAPWVVAGSMGGDAQPQIHAQLVSALVDGGVDVRDRGAAPRWFVEPAAHFEPPVEVRLEPRHAAGIARGARGAGPPGDATSRRSTPTSATSTRSSSSTAARRARRARWPPPPTRAAPGCRRSGRRRGSVAGVLRAGLAMRYSRAAGGRLRSHDAATGPVAGPTRSGGGS